MTDRHSIHLHGDYVDGELSPIEKSDVDAHIASCESCREDLERLTRLKASLATLTTPDPGIEYFDNLTDRIAARTTNAARDDVVAPQRGPDMLKILIRLAAAITLLFGSFYLSNIKQAHSPTGWANQSGQTGKFVSNDSLNAIPAIEGDNPPSGINRVGSPSPDLK